MGQGEGLAIFPCVSLSVDLCDCFAALNAERQFIASSSVFEWFVNQAEQDQSETALLLYFYFISRY